MSTTLPSEIFCFLPTRSGKSHLAKNARLINFRSIYNRGKAEQEKAYVQSLNKFRSIYNKQIYLLKSLLVQSLNKFRSIYNKVYKNLPSVTVQSLNKFIKLSIIYVLPSEIFRFLLIQSEKSVLAKTGSCPY